MKVACKTCPFRRDSKLGFDSAGQRLLGRGYEPSCHKIVGANLQFNDPLPSSETICAGYLSWTQSNPGFTRPFLER